jgi:L-alanine-DL-glutamate epimerase-like enolase superfamily enzyme
LLLDKYEIDFIEQPVMPDPAAAMSEVRMRSRVPVCANEGLWTVEDTYRHIVNRTADVYCFSPYWVGSLTGFQHLSWMAAQEGSRVCKHSHGELGIAAAAAQHALLSLPSIVEGNQQTAQIMRDDVLRDALPIGNSPTWGLPPGTGLGIEVDEDKVGKYCEAYRRHGQFLPYDPKPVQGGFDSCSLVSSVKSR